MRQKSEKIRNNITPGLQSKISKILKPGVNEKVQTKNICPCEGTCPLCKGTIQPKLTVGGESKNRYRQDAARVAKRVNHPGETGNETLQTKQSPNRTAIQEPGLQDQIQTLKGGGGQPLPETTRNYFEPRFGKDLGNIRLHTGTKANDTAASLHAQTFSTGNNIAFAHGYYSPGTTAGKKLLAHEITHTIQQQTTQNKGETLRLRQQPGPFTISDKYEKSHQEKDFVFFDWARPDYSDKAPEDSLDSKEKQKVFARKNDADKSKIPVNQIKLIGYASEEGNVNYNKRLIKRRLQAVKNLLKNEAGYQGPVKIEAKLSASKGKLDYRYWRAVEIRFNDEESTRKDPQEKEDAVCPLEKETVVDDARREALKRLNAPNKGAIPQLNRYIAKPEPNSPIAAALDKLFGGDHSKETAIKVLNRINAIGIFISEMTNQTNILCAHRETSFCAAGGSAATKPDKGLIKFCPLFFSDGFKERRAWTVIHESSHASVYRSDDMAYSYSRAMRVLTTRQALNNADSIEEFIYWVNEGKRRIGPAKPDKQQGCEEYKESVDKAAAVAEHRNIYAKHGTAQTYDKKPADRYMTYYIRKRFYQADNPAIAGIYDRYLKMTH
ncbi:MAG: DUF4157 domain-containing protein, partial [bacterium]|nr:DUF4157 domain-containing protein [bacterium]